MNTQGKVFKITLLLPKGKQFILEGLTALEMVRKGNNMRGICSRCQTAYRLYVTDENNHIRGYSEKLVRGVVLG